MESVSYTHLLFFLALITYLQGMYASNHRSFYRKYNQKDINAGQARSMVFVLATALVCVLTIFIGNKAFFALLLIPMIGSMIDRKYSK